jgi:hypothetical protein
MKSKYFILSSVLFLFACKKEPKDDGNQNKDGKANAEIYYSTPAFYQSAVTDVAASWDGQVMVVKNKDNFFYSKDGGNVFTQVNPGIKNYVPFLVNESGIMAWSDKSYSGFFNLNTGQAINSGIPGFYNQYYLGHNDWMYCLQGTNSSTPPIVFYKKLSDSQWDTLTKNGDSLGAYCGQNQSGGISFFNSSTKRLFNHNPTNNSNTQFVFNDFALGNITEGMSNRPVKYFFNGYNLMVVGYTKGFAVMNTSNLSVNYTNWQVNFKGYYENPVSLSCSKSGTVFANLLSNTNQPYNFEISGSTYKEIKVTCPVINNGNYSYFFHSLNPIKTDGNQTTAIKIGDAKSAEIDYYHPYGGEHYSLIYEGGANTIFLHDKTSSYNLKYLNGYYSFLYKDDQKILICSNDSLLFSMDNGISYQSIKSDFHAPITYLKKINGTYYVLAVKNFKYNLGGTGFQTDRFNIGVYTSSNLKDWTIIPNTLKTNLNGKGPEIFSSAGLMTYIENIEPLGNPVYRGYKSTDFGVTWASSGILPLFNVDLGNSLSYIAYNGSNTISRQNYTLNLDKTNATQYQTSISVPLANQIPMALNGQVLYVSGEQVLILK